MPSELPDITIVADTLIQKREVMVSRVMGAFIQYLSMNFSVPRDNFSWDLATNGDVSFGFRDSPDSETTGAVHELWKKMREKYPAVLIGEEWRNFRASMPKYAKLTPTAFASTFAAKVKGKA